MIFLIIFFIFLASFFSIVETSFITSNPIHVHSKYYKRDKIILRLYSNLNMLVNTTLVGINLSVVSCSILMTTYLNNWFSFKDSVIISSIVLTIVFLLFGEIIPKSMALKNSDFFIKVFSKVFYFFTRIFYPFTLVLSLLNFFGKKNQVSYISRREIEYVLSSGKDYEIKEGEEREKLIKNALDLSKIRIKDIIIPINRVFSISLDENIGVIKKKLKNNYFDKIPVYKDFPSNLVGYVTSKDIIFSENNAKVSDFFRKTLVFPETKTLDKTLFELQEAEKTLGIVVDEYGAISGIVIKNDIIKKIFGDVKDENTFFDDVQELPDNSLIVLGNKDIDYLNKKYGLDIEKDGFNTISGFISYYLNRIPMKGDEFIYKGFVYIVMETKNYIAEKIMIKRVKNESFIFDRHS